MTKSRQLEEEEHGWQAIFQGRQPMWESVRLKNKGADRIAPFDRVKIIERDLCYYPIYWKRKIKISIKKW